MRHPKGMRCLECGFLALDDGEVRTADRIQLGADGEAGHPPLNKLRCIKKLWVNYDLTYFDDSRQGLFDELQERRRPCVGYLQYRPGRSPHEHLDFDDKKRARREKVIDVVLGAAVGIAGTLLTTWLLKHYNLK